MSNQTQYIIEKLRDLSSHGMEDFIDTDIDIDNLEETGTKDYYGVDLKKAAANGALNNIKKITSDKFGKITIELYDQLEILAMLGKVGDYTEPDDIRKARLEEVVAAIQANRRKSKLQLESELTDE